MLSDILSRLVETVAEQGEDMQVHVKLLTLLFKKLTSISIWCQELAHLAELMLQYIVFMKQFLIFVSSFCTACVCHIFVRTFTYLSMVYHSNYHGNHGNIFIMTQL